MAKDPAFLFYPGDYLRDTQTLSEKSQVAYDRIICEHMRNICISKKQLKFFTKRLTDDEIDELMFVLSEVEGGYQIEWVAESISKRKAYSESRRKNRKGNNEKDMNNISKTYVKHMENEIENENVIINGNKKENEKNEKIVFPFDDPEFTSIWQQWIKYKQEQFNFKYKSLSTEQAALMDLDKKSNHNKNTAIEIIMQSIANGWKGFFELKNNNNGNTSKLAREVIEAING